jgi:hypothetical protein
MKWIVTGVFLASLMATPVLAAQIFPSHHVWDHADPRLSIAAPKMEKAAGGPYALPPVRDWVLRR